MCQELGGARLMSYRDLPGIERYGEDALAGDLAEEKVAKVLADMNRPVAPFGPRRVSTERAQQTTWPEVIRFAPDYLGWNRFIECQGFGHERRVIFKERKLDALVFWNGIMPVWFGLYDAIEDTVTFADLPSVLWAIHHPDTQPLQLDAGNKVEKSAYSVPIEVLHQRQFHNAFEAERVAKGKRKRGE
jgi:hypothetical protein